MDQLVQTAWRWHLKEDTELETTTLATQELQRQDETVEFTSTNMSSRQSSRLRGEPASANTEEEADSHMMETRTPSAGSKRAPVTSLTPDRDRSTQMQKTHDLLPDEQMLENPAQVTPIGTTKTDNSDDAELKLSDANFPPLASPARTTLGHPTTASPLAEPPAVPRIPEGTEAQANNNSQQDTSNKPPETDPQVHAPSKEDELAKESPQQKTQETNANALAAKVQTMNVKDTPSLQVDLTGHTYSALWQKVYPRPKKHWTVRGLTMREMTTVTKKLVKAVAKHQNWKGPHAGRELSSDSWRHCINDCLAREETTVKVLGEQMLDKMLGYIVRMAKTDPHILENQKPSNRGSNVVNLDPDDVVNVAYHAIIGMTGNVWKETDHLLEESKGGNTKQSNSSNGNATANSSAAAAHPKNKADNPYVPPHKRSTKPTQKHTSYVELNFWGPVPHPNPAQTFASKDQLKSNVCRMLLDALNKGAKEGDRTAQLMPHTRAGLKSTVVVTQRDIDTTAEKFTKEVLKNFEVGVLNKPKYEQTMALISYEGDLQKILEGMERQVGKALPECKLTARKSRLDSVHTVKCCFLATVVTGPLNKDDLEADMRKKIKNRPDLPQDLHWRLENRVVKRSDQKLNRKQEWEPQEQKEVIVEAVFIISTEEDEEQVTNMMFAIFDKELPMNQLPQCLWANVVADISGPNADPNAMRESNFMKGVMDHVEVAFKPEQGDSKRTQAYATVEVKTIRNLDMRVAECDNKSPREMLRGVVSTTGDGHRLIIQCDHKVNDPETVVVTCRARDVGPVQVLMKRWPFFVTSHYKAGWSYFKDGVQDQLMKTFVRDANGQWIYRYDTNYDDRRRDTSECSHQTRELMEMFREAHENTTPDNCMIENMEMIFEGAPVRKANAGQASIASGRTLNSHGGVTKGDRSGKTLNSKGEVQSPNYDSDQTNNDSIMTEASQATVGNDTVDSGNTIGNSTVKSDDTEMRTQGDSTATPKADNTQEWPEEEWEEFAGMKLPAFTEGQQQFPDWTVPVLDSEHMEKYVGKQDWHTMLTLMDSYTRSINQPWEDTPEQEKRPVWRDTWEAVQTMNLAFHQLKLEGWPNFRKHIEGRHPMELHEEACHWMNTFPSLEAFTRGILYPESLDTDPSKVAKTPVSKAGSKLPKHVDNVQKFPEITYRNPTTTQRTKHLKGIRVQLANQLFEDYTESIGQDWRLTPIKHRSEVWGDTFEDIQRLHLQFHELQHPTWTNFHTHTAGRHPESIQEETVHWQLNHPNLITTQVPCTVPDWTSNNYPASRTAAHSRERSEDE